MSGLDMPWLKAGKSPETGYRKRFKHAARYGCGTKRSDLAAPMITPDFADSVFSPATGSLALTPVTARPVRPGAVSPLARAGQSAPILPEAPLAKDRSIGYVIGLPAMVANR